MPATPGRNPSGPTACICSTCMILVDDAIRLGICSNCLIVAIGGQRRPDAVAFCEDIPALLPVGSKDLRAPGAQPHGS